MGFEPFYFILNLSLTINRLRIPLILYLNLRYVSTHLPHVSINKHMLCAFILFINIEVVLPLNYRLFSYFYDANIRLFFHLPKFFRSFFCYFSKEFLLFIYNAKILIKSHICKYFIKKILNFKLYHIEQKLYS